MKNKIFVLITLVFTYFLFTTYSRAASVEPVYVDGNPKCEDYGLYNVLEDYGTVVEGEVDGTIASWSSTVGIDKVIVKGGSNANLYSYGPESFGDTNLTTPTNPNNNKPFGLSHIDLCADFELSVTKTANTTFDRQWSWEIEKSGDQTQLLLSTNQIFPVNYEVEVSASNVDSEFEVSGEITVLNPSPLVATVTGVEDSLEGIGNVVIDCPVTFPFQLESEESFVCAYSVSVPNNDSRLNTATATTTGEVGGDSGTATADFSNAVISQEDECVMVNDSQKGFLGQFCASSGDKSHTYTYQLNIVKTTCGESTFENIASFETNDTQTTGTDSWVVNISIPCVLGCTLTQGYWKTHSSFGPAKSDPTWALVGPSTTFYLSGKSYYQVLWTAPAGNSYYVLAHQYIAAKLNMLDGATVPATVQTAMTQAETLFTTYTPAQVGALKGNNATRAMFTSLAGTLGAYNEGKTVVPHCSE